MSSNITFNGVTYAIPDDGDFNWGPDLTAFFIAIASGCLQKTGGTFTLGADTDFGASFGLKSLYYKSRHANPASAGQIRLGNAEIISWRNAANGANKDLAVSASDILTFGGTKILLSGAIVNADVDAAAAIAYSKLAALTASRLLVSDGSGFVSVSAVTATEAGYLAGVTSAIQTQMNLKAPLASPTFTGTVTIPVTASRLLVSGASSEMAASAVTATEAGYLAGVTSAIQTQLNAKLSSTLTVPKVTVYDSGSGTFTKTGSPLYIQVEMVGGGGGGSGGGTTNPLGTAGGNSTFGVTVVVANGGGVAANSGGAGGTASLSGSGGIALSGSNGGGGFVNASSVSYAIGGLGGNSAFGGGGSAEGGVAGYAASTNSGAGGGGGSGANAAGNNGGGGGGSGGYAKAIITSPSSTYAYAVGAAGSAGAAGTSGYAGGAGAAGKIIVTEFYQ